MIKKTASALLFLLLATALTAGDSPRLRRVEPRDVGAAEIGAKLRNGRNLFLRTAIFDPATERPDYQSVGLSRPVRAGEYAVVQFRSGDPAAKAELERLGVKFFGYLPDHAYQVRIPPAARQRIAAHASVRWVGEYEAGFKVHPRLWPSRKEKTRAIRVVPFADASVSKTIMVLERRFPDLVVTKKLDGPYAHFAEVLVPAGKEDDFVRAAAALDGVSWLEPHEEMVFHNANSTSAIQGNTATPAGRTLFAHNITGTGQIIAVADSGLDNDMCYFRTLNGVSAMTTAADAATDQPGPLSPTNKVIGYWVQEGAAAYDSAAAGFHGTHTAGTVAGDNFAHPSSPTDPGLDTADGMAPNAQILFQDIGRNDAQGSLTVGDPYAMFLQALRGGARVHSNSYGVRSSGAYTAYDQLVDQFLFDHDDMAIFFSAGNENVPGVTATIGSPANAKNVVSVGAVGAGTNTAVAIFSSRGPTADGRVKPDLVAPGVSINSAFGDESQTTGNCTTISLQGTSMACPTAAGGAALLRQYFADGFYPGGSKNLADTMNASSTLVKSALLNGTLHAMSSSTFGTADFSSRYGWGKIFLDNNLYFPGDTRRLRVWDVPNFHGMVTGESRSFTVSVAAGQELRATLVWTDPEAALGAAKALVNDLDLTVTRGGDTFLGNVFGTSNDSETGGSADRLNNVEQVRLGAPTGGTYTITVRANNVPGNGRSATNRQGFALVVSAATCSAAVSAAPGNLAVKTNPVRGIDLTWSAAAGSTVTQIYRAEGANPAAGAFRYIGTATGTSFTDLRAQGGFTYAYKIRGADDCGEGPLSGAVTFTSTGLCDLSPVFNGIIVAQAEGTNCRIVLSWGTGQATCPLVNSVRYNIYRSSSADFIPSGTPYATTSDTTYSDINVVSGTTYYYIIRAEDLTTASAGPHGGNEDTNLRRLFATAFGPPGATTGTFRDGAGDESAYFNGEVPWQISIEHAHTGTHSYHHAPDFTPYSNVTCASLVTPPITLDANAELSYFARYNLEFQWDGVIVEISTDNGANWADLPPAGGYPDTLAETQGPSGTIAPVNACGYLRTKGAFTGPSDNAGLTPWTEYRSSLALFAGQTVKIRWRFTSDPGLEYQGFYLDDIVVTNVKLADPCTPIAQKPVAAFTNSPGVGTRGLPVTFKDTSSNTPASWLWNFGDGTSSTQQNPTHTYAVAGTFTVTLTATNAHGSGSVTRSIKVNEPSQGPSKRRSARH
ncbi:MAG TPA: S8 family serine peptidase [Thermoanaerobaculia bacterium]|nr:S8 family serine peptidase [Thermoanaerobaculia bacterium]